MNDTYLMLFQILRDEFVGRFMAKTIADDYTYFTMAEVAEVLDGAKEEVENIIKGKVS